MISIFRTLLLLVPATAATLALPRDGATVLADLRAINDAVRQLEAADKQFTVDQNPIPVQNGVNQVELTHILAIADSARTSPLAAPDAASIADYVADTLYASTVAAITASEANKNATDAQGISIVVAIELQELKALSNVLGRNLAGKSTSASLAVKIRAAFAKVAAAYERGIVFYSR